LRRELVRCGGILPFVERPLSPHTRAQCAMRNGRCRQVGGVRDPVGLKNFRSARAAIRLPGTTRAGRISGPPGVSSPPYICPMDLSRYVTPTTNPRAYSTLISIPFDELGIVKKSSQFVHDFVSCALPLALLRRGALALFASRFPSSPEIRRAGRTSCQPGRISFPRTSPAG